MYPISPRIILILLFSASLVAAANFTQCLEDFKADPGATGGVDSHGHDVSAADAVGLNYRTCTERCGSTAESLGWRQFAQSFVWWLLPWLALVGELPFGSGNHIDDFVSVFMSVGSPALAAYSLMVSSFNVRTVYNKANLLKHKEKADVAEVLVALQQIPLELTTDSRLLVSIPVDAKWRHEILERLVGGYAWSLTTPVYVAWAIITFVFTIIDAFLSLEDPGSVVLEGLSLSTLWLWLPCLVIGWLWLPSFSPKEIYAALHHSNRKAVRDAAKRQRYNPKTSEKPDAGPAPIVTVVGENEEAKQGPTDEGETHAGDLPELRSTPSATSLQASAESQQDHSHPSIGGVQTAQHSIASVVYSVEAPQPPAAISATSLQSGQDGLFIPKEKVGPLHINEFRHSATFNYSRIMWYLVLVDDLFRALDRPVLADEKKRPSSGIIPPPPEHTTFPPGALRTMSRAAFFALFLQVGVTSAAVVITIFTPTIGLGCRSLGYILYGAISIIIMSLTIISTILARISETHKDRSPSLGRITAFFAIIFHRICSLLALLNLVGLIVLSCLQFSNLLANCYCNSSALGNGTNTYIVIVLRDWVPTMRNSRAIGIGIAAGSTFVFMLSLALISSPPKDLRSI